MKRGTLNFLGRKNQSLFDTNIKIKDMDNVELVLESSAIPESGTASVRARPTVKHHASPSLESFQGFAVPTPKVPLLPPVNGPKINGSVSGDKISNGSALSVPDLLEGELLIPPAPSMAPPPPPSMAPPPPPSAVPSPSFIPPPPDFMGDMNNLNLATLQHPTTPAAKPAPLSPSLEEQDLTLLKPPPMAPPKPPSTSSSGSASSLRISSPPTVNIPEHPKFAPPQPPSEGQHKTHKTPPPKPVRLSSMSHLDSPPLTPAPPPPVQTPTRSTFNPQNTAKLYNVPKPSILSYEDRDTRPKQMLLLEDSGSVNSAPVLVQVDGNAPKVATPAKPVSKDVQELKENLQMTKPSPPPLPEPDKEAKTEIVSASPKTDKPVLTPQQTSPQLPKMNKTLTNSEPYKDKLDASPSQGHKFSPLLDRKLRSLKASDSNGVREGHAASPLALLMAAKEREKQRSTHTVSRENSAKKNEPPCASIQPSVSSPNSFIVTPRSSSSSSLTSQEKLHESPKSVRPAENTQLMQTPQKSSKDQMPSISSTLSQETASPSVIGLVEQRQKIEQTPSKSPFKQNESNKEELSMPLLPPPPEFDDADEFMEPPPSIVPPAPPSIPSPAPPAIPPPAPPSIVPPAPPSTSTPAPPAIPPPAPPSTTTPAPPAIPPSDAPTKKAPAATGSPLPVSQAPSPPTPPKPPKAPKLPPSDADVKPRPPVLTKPKTAPNQLPSPLSPNQATLLSILQKKMLEMDHKMAPVKEAESSADDWGAPLSDEDNKVPVVSKATPQSKNTPVVNKGATLDMRELENKVARKYQETSTIKSPTSNGVQSKHQYGMTFTVRPGTKQPITLKGDP